MWWRGQRSASSSARRGSLILGVLVVLGGGGSIRQRVQRRQPPDEVDKRTAVFADVVSRDPIHFVVLAIRVVIAVLRATEFVARQDHWRSL